MNPVTESKVPQNVIEYSKTLCTLGLISGMGLVIGLPVLVLVFGHDGTLTSGSQAMIIIASLIVGAIVITVSVFFGTVIPHRIRDNSEGGFARSQPADSAKTQA